MSLKPFSEVLPESKDARIARLERELEAANTRISDFDAARANVTAKVREIHEVMKRGKATGDHGLSGNLACILDHALRRFDPKDEPEASEVCNALDAAASLCDLSTQSLKLMAGEMTAKEVRTTKAVLKATGARIRALKEIAK